MASTQRLVWLDHQRIAFPPTAAALADPNGLLAAGGDLTPEWLLAAYRRGVFPWYSNGQPILWWSPCPRCVVFPQAFRVGRSLQKYCAAKPSGSHLTAHSSLLSIAAAPRGPMGRAPGLPIGCAGHLSTCIISVTATLWRYGAMVTLLGDSTVSPSGVCFSGNRCFTVRKTPPKSLLFTWFGN